MLEEEINNLIYSWNGGNLKEIPYNSIERWHISSNHNFNEDGINVPLKKKIHDLIDKAPLEICLTSSSSYVRECKKWLMQYEIHQYDGR